MLFNSYAEFLTLKVAWEEYQHIWELLSATGIVLIPFIVFFIQAILRSYIAQEQDYGSLLSQLELRFFSMIFCFILAGQPYLNMNASVVSHHQSEQFCEQPGSQDDSDHFLDWPSHLIVPFLWGFSMGISSAFIEAIGQSIGRDHDARSVMVSVDLAVIKNIGLLLETKSFIQQCFLPSLRKYMREKENLDTSTEDTMASKVWMGDPYFLHHPGYYDYFTSLSHSIEEKKILDTGEVETTSSYLSCQEWWSGPHGLQYQLIEELQERVPGLAHYVQQKDFSVFLKKMVQQSVQKGYSSHLTEERVSHEVSFFSWVSHMMGRYGLAQESLSFYPFMSVLIESLPLFQALLLMAGIVFYPFFILLAQYRFGSAIRYLIFWISIQFWSYVWALAGYLDNVLIESLYPGLSLDFAGKLLIDMVALLMYMVLPLYGCFVMNQRRAINASI